MARPFPLRRILVLLALVLVAAVPAQATAGASGKPTAEPEVRTADGKARKGTGKERPLRARTALGRSCRKLRGASRRRCLRTVRRRAAARRMFRLRARYAVGCAGSDLRPTGENLAAVRAATLCLLNRERVLRHRRPLHSNDRLLAAADRHSHDMVRRGYFAHRSPSSGDVVTRASAAGYITRGISWRVGENLAWGTGELATPRATVRAWMSSPGHRANILDGRFREIGVSAILGAPRAGASGGATYTTVFGARRRP